MSPPESPVLNIIAERMASKSLPLKRTDSARVAVVIEGGSARAAYSGGMVLELENRGLLQAFDAIYGTSAGALNGAWLACGRANIGMRGWWDPQITKNIVKPYNFFYRKPIIDAEEIIYDLYENLTPMGFDEILNCDIEYHPIATLISSGESVDLSHKLTNKELLQNAMRASTRMPLLSGLPVEVDGDLYIDGAISEHVPVETALRDGATHVLVLRTRTPSLEEVPTNPVKYWLVKQWMKRHAPGSLQAWKNLPTRRRQAEETIASSQNISQVYPDQGAQKISVIGGAERIQKGALEEGQRLMSKYLEGALL